MKHLLSAAASVLCVYLLFVFGTATFDISLWEQEARAICAGLMCIAAIAGGVVSGIIGSWYV